MPPRDVATRRPTRTHRITSLHRFTEDAPRVLEALRRRRARRASRNARTHAGKDAASTAAALAKAFGSSDADGCWLLSLVASDSTAPWSMTYYGKVLDGFARRPVTFFVRF